MRVLRQSLSPGVQHGEEADLCAEMIGIGGDGAQRLGRRAEQDVVDHGLVLERDVGDLGRHGEHDVEIRHVAAVPPARPRAIAPAPDPGT